MENKVLCPYCGWEMAISKYNVQEGGVIGHVYFCEMCDSTSPIAGTKSEALSAALQRYVEPNRVLTPEELQGMEGEPVFIQQGDGDEYWSVVKAGSLLIGECDPDFQDMTCSFDKDGHFGLHVLGWRALERRPTDEERQSVVWEESQ